MFLEGILRNDGGSFFDGLSFHAYDYYQGRGKYYGNLNWQSAWNTTGPVEIAKALYIKSLLSKYGTTGKFIMASEVAILCTWCSSHNADLETTKAYYVVEAYSAAIALGLRSNIWFSLQGWDSSGLINEDLTILPAFPAFQFSSSKLANSTWERDIDEYPGVKIIEFARGERRIWVLWSSDGNSHLITLPSMPLAAWDDLGNHVIPEASMNISISPIYLDWNP